MCIRDSPEGVAALRAEQVGDVQREGPVAAPVSPGQTAIDLHRAGVVHRPEVEQDAPALARRGREGAVLRGRGLRRFSGGT